MRHDQPALCLTDTEIRNVWGTIFLADLPDPQPQNPARLHNTTPLIERLWRIALADIESNIVNAPDGARYFGAGASFGFTIYTRDISYAGVLGLNRLYPDLMLDSLRFTRAMRRRLGFRVSRGYRVPEIPGPWVEEDISEKDYLHKYATNSFTRRTDDVVWLWCAGDLVARRGRPEEWRWLYETGREFFRDVYAPFYDQRDGLYHGQPSFIDIHFTDHKTSGYPQEWGVADCVLVKALSTNCLYVLGLRAMAAAATQLGLTDEAAEWGKRERALTEAIRRELRRPDGTYSYFKDRHGLLQDRCDALGCALLVHAGVVAGEDAVAAIGRYPVTVAGAPLFHPFFPWDVFYHNNSSWPFVDTFFLHALEKADGRDRSALNAALLARTCVDNGSFHEVVDYRTNKVGGSGRQLWSAAAFLNVCFRAGLVTDG